MCVFNEFCVILSVERGRKGEIEKEIKWMNEREREKERKKEKSANLVA